MAAKDWRRSSSGRELLTYAVGLPIIFTTVLFILTYPDAPDFMLEPLPLASTVVVLSIMPLVIVLYDRDIWRSWTRTAQIGREALLPQLVDAVKAAGLEPVPRRPDQEIARYQTVYDLKAGLNLTVRAGPEMSSVFIGPDRPETRRDFENARMVIDAVLDA